MKPAVLTSLVVAIAACGSAMPAPASTLGGTVNVFAATSLTAAFRDEAAAFEKRYPRTAVELNFAGSAELATQINQGAPADVFASADAANLQKVVTAGNATGTPKTFATNLLEIIVAPGNPKRIRSLADLAAPGLVIVLCAPAVPCGSYARQALAKAGVQVTPKSDEQNVAGVASKVESGDADAGIVYTTDVKAAAAKAAGIPIPTSQNVVATYPIIATKGGSNPAGARAFIDFVLSAPGEAILARYGFSKP